jgi:hypothetical protein
MVLKDKSLGKSDQCALGRKWKAVAEFRGMVKTGNAERR